MSKKKTMAKRIEKFEQKQRDKQQERTNRIIEMKKAGYMANLWKFTDEEAR